MSSAQQLLSSAYEAARLENIKSNEAALLALGLTIATPKASTSATADSAKKRKASAASNKATKKAKTQQEPARRSRRQQNQTPEIDDGTPSRPSRVVNADDENEVEAGETESAFMARKIERLKELHTQNMTAYKNPTATYEHTWMRVRTMTDKKLLVRVKVIERAMGQHCLVKMRMFAEVLILAGKVELAQAAQESLERLLVLAGKKHVGADEKHVVHVVATPEEKKAAEEEEEKEKMQRANDAQLAQEKKKKQDPNDVAEVEQSKDKPVIDMTEVEKGSMQEANDNMVQKPDDKPSAETTKVEMKIVGAYVEMEGNVQQQPKKDTPTAITGEEEEEE